MSEQPAETLYGFYSTKQLSAYGSSIYSTPDGGEVEVTEVGNTDSPRGWDDAVLVGVVVKYLRTGRRGSNLHYDI